MATSLEAAADGLCSVLETAEGFMRTEELRFLFLAAALPTAKGEAVEIGSFKGKSTVALAKGALWSGQSTVVACDPFPPTLSRWSPDRDVYQDFLATLERYGVSQHVQVHRERSMDMLAKWDRPIRLLWVDGDHRYPAVKADVEGFSAHLVPGALVALHDVGVREHPGPQLCFLEEVLLSDAFGMCGMWCSIGWAQFIGSGGLARYRREKVSAHRLLSAYRLRQVFRLKLPKLVRWRYKRFRKGDSFARWIRTACPDHSLWNASVGPWPSG